MAPDRVGGWISLLRQGLKLDVDFGTHSVEAMAWIAEVIESSIYRKGSLRRSADGIRFVLANPPLRLGAFSRIGLQVNGTIVAPERWTIRTGLLGTARLAASVGAETPVELRPGEPIEVDASVGTVTGTVHVRLELESVAIPPRVWMEFDDAVREEGE